MCAPAKTLSTTSHRRARLLCSLAAIASLGLLAALTFGVVTAQPAEASTAAPALGARLVNNYQLRCWQQGQLVLEESLVQAPADAAATSIRLQGAQGAGTAVMLLNAGTSTCLLKPVR